MPPSKQDAGLYGAPRPKKLKGNPISSSNSLAFSSQLSSLIATSSSRDGSNSAPGRSRLKKKEDIFATHNKNAKKRALKDLEDTDYSQQRHSTTSEAVDDATWKRARRKMEEKARLYAAMKRGDVEDEGDKYAVDFDRKWAEKQENGEEADTSEGEDDEGSDEELVEYVDEFGRTRQGTKAQAAREERNKRSAALMDDHEHGPSRVSAPSNVIYGNTIQSNAFNPDEPVAAQMEEIARKRDKGATPPPEEHFDGLTEVRTKGVGFFQFSGDAEQRKKQMAELEKERSETERKRAAIAQKKEERRKELEQRKKEIAEKRGKAKADRFLNGLLGEMGDTAINDQGDASKDKGDEAG